MKQPNLDALAKLGPFRVSDNSWDGYEIEGSYRVVEPDDIAAALNEWVELRAYRERTEAALVKLAARHERSAAHAESNKGEPNKEGTPTHFWTIMADETAADIAGLMSLGLWRDPAPKEASDGK